MVCTLLPLGAFADEAASGDCGNGVTWKYSDGTLTISGAGAMNNYDSPEKGRNNTSAPWHENYAESIKTIVIEDGVTSIGNNAFYGCQNMTGINIPASVKTIGRCAFGECDKLRTVNLPEGLKKIGDNAFQACCFLTKITIPGTVTSIGDFAFYDCINLKTITIPASVTNLGDSMFYDCSSLTDIYVSPSNNAYTSLGGVLLSKDRSVLICYPAGKSGEYTISSGVKEIANSAFYGSNGLRKVSIPATITVIGNFAFERCENLTSINVAANNPNYLSENGVLFNKNKTELICCPGGYQGKYIIPDSVTSIKISAFEFCSKLTGITIPDGIKTIDNCTFAGCDSLKSVIVPGHVTTIGDYAFDGCRSLTDIELPGSITSIGTGAFSECKSLKEIRIPDRITTVAQYTFAECAGLESITIPVGVTSIGDSAFRGCSSLKEVNYVGSQEQWGKIKIDKNNEPLSKAQLNCNEDPNGGNPFVDVKRGTYCYDPVLWAYNHNPQITAGMDNTHFQPDSECIRAQIVTFLWRANGSPEPKTEKCQFVDVDAKAFYYKAVLWAVENEITKGIDDTHFAPFASCTRAQAVTFLWRADGKPSGSANCPFKDVTKGEYYYDAMLWAVNEKITKGIDSSHFAPNNTCTRGQIVTFLYRDTNIK